MIIIIITDLYSAFRSEDTEVLDNVQAVEWRKVIHDVESNHLSIVLPAILEWWVYAVTLLYVKCVYHIYSRIILKI